MLFNVLSLFFFFFCFFFFFFYFFFFFADFFFLFFSLFKLKFFTAQPHCFPLANEEKRKVSSWRRWHLFHTSDLGHDTTNTVCQTQNGSAQHVWLWNIVFYEAGWETVKNCCMCIFIQFLLFSGSHDVNLFEISPLQAVLLTLCVSNSKHWFMTSFLQPLPYLVTL